MKHWRKLVILDEQKNSMLDNTLLQCLLISYSQTLYSHTVFHKKTSTSYTCNKVYHLTSNVLPHYLVKTQCSTVQLYSTLFNASVM